MKIKLSQLKKIIKEVVEEKKLIAKISYPYNEYFGPVISLSDGREFMPSELELLPYEEYVNDHNDNGLKDSNWGLFYQKVCYRILELCNVIEIIDTKLGRMSLKEYGKLLKSLQLPYELQKLLESSENTIKLFIK